MHLQGIVCTVQGSIEGQRVVCMVWQIMHSVKGSMEGSLYLHGRVYTQHSVQGSMDHWRGETLAGGTTYLMAPTSHQQ